MKPAVMHEEKFDLRHLNTFQISSIADCVYLPHTQEEFIELLETLDNPLILGGGSNILFSSAGVKQPVISTRALDLIELDDGYIITAQAGVKTPILAQFAAKNALSGFEFLAPIPATIGGAVCMNASAHKQAISDVLLSAKLFDFDTKEIVKFSSVQMDLGYRNSILKSGHYIFLSGKFELIKASPDAINSRMEANLAYRKEHHPSLKLPNAGSIFKNPPEGAAGALIDKCGLKGTKIGGAQIFENHGNFIVNIGSATSQNVCELMFLAYNEVKKKFGVKLVPEILFVGEKESEIWEKMLKKE